METTKTFISWWTDKDDAVHIHHLSVFIHKNEWNYGICNNMDELENIRLHDVSQPQKDKFHVIYSDVES